MSDGGSIETLGGLADNKMGLVWYCNDCDRKLDLDLAAAISRWGRGQVFINWRPPIKCSGCGSRNVSSRVQAHVPGRIT